MEIRSILSSSTTPSTVGRSDIPASASLPEAAAKPATSTALESAVRQPSRSAETEQVKHAVEDIERMMKLFSRNVEFSYDSDENRTIMRVIDQNTKEVIRQVPTQEALEIAKALAKIQDLLLVQGGRTSGLK